jgi:diaminopimelate epimerase
MPNLVAEFTKWSGAGNDFVALDNRFYALGADELPALARQLCHRGDGIGADGLLVLSADGDPFDPSAPPRMTIYNADGSRPTMCGNGARCMARMAAESGLGTPDGDAVRLVLATDAGDVGARVRGDQVALDLPPARDLREQAVDGDTLHYAWTGTEHAVLFVDDVDAIDVDARGRALRRAAAWGEQGANIGFAQPMGPGRIRVRTFEKGVEAETRACGTGAVAAALATALRGDAPAEGGRTRVAVETRGGELRVGFALDPDARKVRDVTLEGPAVRVFRGTFEIDGGGLAAV